MRTRLVKPGFFKDSDLAKCSPLARILFLGLACLADRDGRLRDKPDEIKVDTLPYDTVDIESLLEELCKRCLISRYEVDGIRLIQVSKDEKTFRKHARPHANETSENLPANNREITRVVAKLPGELFSSNTNTFSYPDTSLSRPDGPPCVSQIQENPPKPELPSDLSPAMLARQWCFVCTRRFNGRSKDDERDMAGEFANLEALGVPAAAMLEEINRGPPQRDRGEHFWQFKDRLMERFNLKQQATGKPPKKSALDRLIEGAGTRKP